MGQEKEASFPIEEFGGVNRNAGREDLSPIQLYAARNLWEKTLGTLETRGGSSIVADNFPSNITTMGNIFKIYKSWGAESRFAVVTCEPDVLDYGTLPAGVTLSFVSDTDGWWNQDRTFGGTTFAFDHSRVVLRFVGYGVDKYYSIPPTVISGYAAATRQKLRVVVSSAQDSNITGIEVMATVKCGQVETYATPSPTSNYNERTIWVGFVDLVSQSTGTFDFLKCPYGYNTGIATPATIAGTERSFSVRSYVNNGVDPDGTLPAGATYYVAILPQYAVFDNNPNSRCQYRNPNVDVNGGEVVKVTIPGVRGEFGGIAIQSLTPNTLCFLVAIGETPQTLIPAFIGNDSTATLPFITSFPRYSPAMINTIWTAASAATLSFTFSQYSLYDMFLGINDDGSYYPVFASNMGTFQYEDTYYDGFAETLYVPFENSYVYAKNNRTAALPKLGVDDSYTFIQYQDFCLFTNTHSPLGGSQDVSEFPPTTYSNYFITDGNIAAPVIEDYKTSPINLPSMKFITHFDGSVILGGGAPNIDPATGAKNDSSRTMYFSRALNPFDFTIPGASSPTFQTVAFFDDPEFINGFGIYTNSSTDQGPTSQLIISKKNSLLVMNQLPSVTSGSLNASVVNYASKKVGSVGHRVFCNTPIGTIFAGLDNVYLMRDAGEPAPIGQALYDIFRTSDFSGAVASYHDKHYKLSFKDRSLPSTGGGNNCEMWLNVNKMIEMKGREEWVGPMTGRAVDYVFVEDLDGDGLDYRFSRDRFCVDRNNRRVYIADEGIYDQALNQMLDFTTPVEAIFESKDFEISQQDNNWNKLIKRWYWKLKTNFVVDGKASLTDQTYIEGKLVDTQTIKMVGRENVNWTDQVFQLIRLFPKSRIRGRTVRKILSSQYRIAISGFQLNYEIEKRRI